MQSQPAIRALQITDLHLKADSGALWRGHNVQKALDSVLRLAAADPHWPPELILVTGDIVDDETPAGYQESYARLAKQLRKQLGKAARTTRIAYIPGNHDDPVLLTQSCRELEIESCGSFEVDNWQVIQLDSTIPHNCDGELGAAQLERLQKALLSGEQPNILITLHHPLVKLDSEWMDSMRVKDAEDFFALVEAFNENAAKSGRSVKVVIWGHAHQETDLQRGSLRLLGAPAAGPVQFTVGSDDFAIDEALAPGLRWLTLYPDGSLETRVERIEK
ncbi:MAG: metallophosphoesterase [Pseudomonadales bacterium]